MNILMILSKSFIHDPRVYNEVKSLIKAGHKVSVISWDRYNQSKDFETVNGIDVYGVHNTNFMRRLPNDIFRNPFWWRFAVKKGLEVYNDGFKFDVVHCHDLDTLYVGVRLKHKTSCKLIFDAHEIFGYLIASNVPRVVSNTAFLIERILLKKVDHMITVNEPLKEYYESKTKKPITIIMNCKKLVSEKYIPTNNKGFTLIYIGSLNKNRFLLELVDIVKGIPDIKLILGGRGRPEFEDKLKEKIRNSSNIDFTGVIPIDDVLLKTKQADLLISMTDPSDHNCNRASTNKQFEAMVCGRPIICTKNTYPGEFTEKEKCGLAASYDKKDLEKVILKLKNDTSLQKELGENALSAAIREYNWDVQADKLVKIYDTI